jgi:hypothetical protein
MKPLLPALPTPDLRQKFYGKSSTDDLICKLLLTQDIARRNSEVASDEAERQLNEKAEPHSFLPDQLVLLDEHSFLTKNQKLASKLSGPHNILRLIGEFNIDLLLWHNNKKLITHVNRLKPYIVPKSAAVTSPDFFPAEKPATPPPVAVQEDATENFSPTTTSTLWTHRSTQQTLPLLIPFRRRSKPSDIAIHLRCHPSSMTTLHWSVLPTLPLHSLPHMRKLLLALVNIFLLPRQLLRITTFLKTASRHALALALALAHSRLSIPRSTCRKFPLTPFQF